MPRYKIIVETEKVFTIPELEFLAGEVEMVIRHIDPDVEVETFAKYD